MDAKGELRHWTNMATADHLTATISRYRTDAKVIATIDAETGRELDAYCDALERLQTYFKSRTDPKG